MTLAQSERPKATASRIKGTRAVLKSALLLKRKAERALMQRAQSDEERLILGCLVARLTASIAELGTLPLPQDPREWRTVRKSASVPRDWSVGLYES